MLYLWLKIEKCKFHSHLFIYLCAVFDDKLPVNFFISNKHCHCHCHCIWFLPHIYPTVTKSFFKSLIIILGLFQLIIYPLHNLYYLTEINNCFVRF